MTSPDRDPQSPLTYREAGVDIDAQDRALSLIKEHLRSTRTPGVLSDLGSFGGLFRVPQDVADAVLVASTDGVGTKLMVAQMAGEHDGVGVDLVNHCVNDILVMGAKPLFFLDYLACGKVDPQVIEALVGGVARACRANGCALLGGETAEMPDMYRPNEYDLAGTIVGIVSRGKILDGSRVKPGDIAFGLGSTGLHTNGYSLARRIVFDRMKLGIHDELPGTGTSVARALLAHHKSYLGPIPDALDHGWVNALAHITGGGLTDNVPRILPEACALEVELGSWPVPGLFETLRRAGQVPDDDMLRTFNMGIGMVALVPEEHASAFNERLNLWHEPFWKIGRVVPGESRVVYKGRLA